MTTKSPFETCSLDIGALIFTYLYALDVGRHYARVSKRVNVFGVHSLSTRTGTIFVPKRIDADKLLDLVGRLCPRVKEVCEMPTADDILRENARCIDADKLLDLVGRLCPRVKEVCEIPTADDILRENARLSPPVNSRWVSKCIDADKLLDLVGRLCPRVKEVCEMPTADDILRENARSSIGLPTRLHLKCLPERFLAQFTPSSTCNLTSLSINRLTPEILQWTFLTSFPQLAHLAMPYRAKIDIDLSLIARYAPLLQSLDTTLHLDTNSLVCSYIVSQGSSYQLPHLSYLRPYWTSKSSLAPILKWASSGRVEHLQLNWPFHAHEVHRVSRRECLSLLEERFSSLQTLDLCLVRHDEDFMNILRHVPQISTLKYTSRHRPSGQTKLLFPKLSRLTTLAVRFPDEARQGRQDMEDFVEKCPNLTELSLKSVNVLENLLDLDKLCSLSLINCSGFLEFIENFDKLKFLRHLFIDAPLPIGHERSTTFAEALSRTDIQSLDVVCSAETALELVQTCTRLRYFEARRMPMLYSKCDRRRKFVFSNEVMDACKRKRDPPFVYYRVRDAIRERGFGERYRY